MFFVSSVTSEGSPRKRPDWTNEKWRIWPYAARGPRQGRLPVPVDIGSRIENGSFPVFRWSGTLEQNYTSLTLTSARRPLSSFSPPHFPPSPSDSQTKKNNKRILSIWRLFSVNRVACARSCTRLRPPHCVRSAPAPMPLRPTCPTCRQLLVAAPSWARHWLSRALAPTLSCPVPLVAPELTALALPVPLVPTCTPPVLKRLRLWTTAL